MSILEHIRCCPDQHDSILLGEVLQYVALNSEKYIAEEVGENNTDSTNTQTKGDSFNSDDAETLKHLGDLLDKKSSQANFSDVVKEIIDCVRQLVLEDKTRGSFGVTLWLTLCGLVNCVASGKVTKQLPDSLGVRQCASFFKYMKCKSQAEYEAAFFCLKNIANRESRTVKTLRHAVSPADFLHLVECCGTLRRTFSGEAADLIFSTWKDQLADVALMSAGDGVVFANELQNRTVQCPDVKQTLAQLETPGNVPPEFQSTEFKQFSNAAAETREALQRKMKQTYLSSQIRLEVKTMAAVVDLELASRSGMYSEQIVGKSAFLECSDFVQHILCFREPAGVVQFAVPGGDNFLGRLARFLAKEYFFHHK